MSAMLYECHGHALMDGADFRAARARHLSGVDETAVRACLESLQGAGVTYFRDGGDSLGVSLRAREIGKDSPSALRLVGLCDGDLCAPGGASPETAARLAELFPETTALVYLGGVSTREEVDALRAASPRISRFAVSGMALATSEDPAAILRAILRDNPA